MIAAPKAGSRLQSTARTCKTGRKAPRARPKRVYFPLRRNPPQCGHARAQLRTYGTPGFGCQHTKQPRSATVAAHQPFWVFGHPFPRADRAAPQRPKSSVLHEDAACFASLPCPGSLLKPSRGRAGRESNNTNVHTEIRTSSGNLR